MDAQNRYEMSLKKKDLFINLSSDDVMFISRQMDQWCRILLDGRYVPASAPATCAAVSPVAPPVAVAAEQPPPPAAPSPVTPVIPAVALEPPPVIAPSIALPSPPPAVPVPQALPEPIAASPSPPPVPAASVAVAPPAAVLEFPSPSPLPVPAPAPVPAAVVAAAASAVPVAAAPSQDNFEAVMDSVMRDLEQATIEASPAAYPPPAAAATLPFPAPAPAIDEPASLGDLYQRSQVANVFDSLLLAAFHLTCSEQQETFSLKRLNSALVKAGVTPVNHSVLESALSAGVLAMVPDLTGTADVSEYRLTPEGLRNAHALL